MWGEDALHLTDSLVPGGHEGGEAGHDHQKEESESGDLRQFADGRQRQGGTDIDGQEREIRGRNRWNCLARGVFYERQPMSSGRGPWQRWT